jgi:hypothetical protein
MFWHNGYVFSRAQGYTSRRPSFVVRDLSGRCADGVRGSSALCPAFVRVLSALPNSPKCLFNKKLRKPERVRTQQRSQDFKRAAEACASARGFGRCAPGQYAARPSSPQLICKMGWAVRVTGRFFCGEVCLRRRRAARNWLSRSPKREYGSSLEVQFETFLNYENLVGVM